MTTAADATNNLIFGLMEAVMLQSHPSEATRAQARQKAWELLRDTGKSLSIEGHSMAHVRFDVGLSAEAFWHAHDMVVLQARLEARAKDAARDLKKNGPDYLA